MPVRVAYDQWTQFEIVPEFMEGVEQVMQIDDRTLEWSARDRRQGEGLAGRDRRAGTRHLIAWRSTEGAQNDGTVRFDKASGGQTRLDARARHRAGRRDREGRHALGVVERRVKGDLERFKAFIESRQAPTGAWRGTVDDGRAG